MFLFFYKVQIYNVLYKIWKILADLRTQKHFVKLLDIEI